MDRIDTRFLMTSDQLPSNIKCSHFALPSASLTFRDLAFHLQVTDKTAGRKSRLLRKTILEPCSGHIDAGELVALMGPSGSGKTTLLDMLAMKKTAAYEGEVFVNGKQRSRKLFARIAAYVGQEDMMPAHWKVREAVMFNAYLKQNSARMHRSIDEWVDLLMETFGLTVVEDSYIGGEAVRGISGGQRRRVTLARGVAAHSSLLFCDEPTSGLSATDAELCVKALRTICKRLRVTCVVVIHQPRSEVAEMFDKFVLLTSHPGRVVYFGPMCSAEAYWRERGHPLPQNVNPTDYFMDTVTPGTRTDVSKALVEDFDKYQKPFVLAKVDEVLEQSDTGMSIKEMIRSAASTRSSAGAKRISSKLTGDDWVGEYAVPFCAQFNQCLARKVKLTLRNPQALGLPICVPVAQGLLVGYMFLGTGQKPFDRQIMFTFCLVTILCLAGTMGLIVLITERTLMKFESGEKLYSEMAWALATQLVDVPLALTGAVLNVIIMILFAQMPARLFADILAWSLLLFAVYDSMFAFVGAVAKDTRQAQVLASPLVSLFMLFNGLVVTEKDTPTPLKWIFFISPNAYAMKGITCTLAHQKEFKDSFVVTAALQQMGMDCDSSQALRGVIILACLIATLRIGQFLGLKYLNAPKR
uniref:ABC transporter domain-containing protein n=1 Tax=Zooxanthella nutricula TaxID=1333877 RepID=A0A7S2MKD6_9DINO